MKKEDEKNPAADLVKEFFKKNPEARKLITPQPDGYLFSQGLRDVLSGFGDMDVRECVKSHAFLKALCKHAGMSDEKFDEILNGSDDAVD